MCGKAVYNLIKDKGVNKGRRNEMSNKIIHETGENISNLTLMLHSNLANPHTISKSCDIPQSHMRVLFILRWHEKQTMSEIAKFLGISKPNLTPIIDRLIEEGYVERSENKKDRRILLISLKDKGVDYLESLNDKVKQHTREKLESLSEEDLSSLHIYSEKMIEIIDKLK